MELAEVQNKLLKQLEIAALSLYENGEINPSNISYLQAVEDCCAMAGIPNSEIQAVKCRGMKTTGDV